jgi:ribosomal protein L34
MLTQKGEELLALQARLKQVVYATQGQLTYRASKVKQTSVLAFLARRLVVAFEVDLAEVCGLDYVWRLCEDGRLVLEARQVVKREFLTARRPQLPARQK